METVTVNLGARSYPIFIGTGVLAELEAEMRVIARDGGEDEEIALAA